MLLTRYIIKELLQPFLLSLAVITFLLGIQYVLQLMDSVASKGLPLSVVLEILTLSLAWMFALSIPMSCLVAALMAFGRLSADREIVALKGAGLSPMKMLFPALVLASIIMVGLMAFNNYVLPEANHRNAAILSSISRKKPQAFINSGQLIKDFPGIQIWIDKIDNETGTLHGIKIFEFQRRGSPKVIYAKYGMLEYQDMGATLLLYLFHGENHLPQGKSKDSYLRIGFVKQVFSVKNVDSDFELKERNYRGDREMSVEEMFKVVEKAERKYGKIKNDQKMWKEVDFVKQLAENAIVQHDSLLLDSLGSVGMDSNSTIQLSQNMILNTTIDSSKKAMLSVSIYDSIPPLDTLFYSHKAVGKLLKDEESRKGKVEKVLRRLKRQKERLSQYSVEIHKKFSIPVACVVFILIGGPLGIMARSGGIGTGVIYSIFFFILYWTCLTGGERLADRLFIPAWLGMWAPNIILGVTGLYLTRMVTRDNFTGNNRILNLFGKIKRLILFKAKGADAPHN
ncbi:MAG: LptF/LptG family permease [Fibrobacterales bacterium]